MPTSDHHDSHFRISGCRIEVNPGDYALRALPDGMSGVEIAGCCEIVNLTGRDDRAAITHNAFIQDATVPRGHVRIVLDPDPPA